MVELRITHDPKSFWLGKLNLHLDPIDALKAAVILLPDQVSKPVYVIIYKSLRGLQNSFMWPFRKKETLVAVQYAAQENIEELLEEELM